MIGHVFPTTSPDKHLITFTAGKEPPRVTWLHALEAGSFAVLSGDMLGSLISSVTSGSVGLQDIIVHR